MAPDCKVSLKSSSLLSLTDAQDLGEWIGVKGGAVFVPSQNQCQLTADDILAHAAFDTSSNSSTCGGDKTQQQQPSSDRVDRFLNPGIDMANLEKYLEFMSDEGLKEVLGHQDTIVQRLFESGAVQRTSWTQCHGRSHLYDRLPRKLDSSSINYEFTHFETFLLLQAHFSRVHLPAELITNQRLILEKILNLLSANVWLKALSTMAIAQMCVQAVWERDSPLKQIPHFEAEVIRRCADAGLESVYDVMGYGGWKCKTLLHAAFVNSYPSLDVTQELVKGECTAGALIFLQVTLSRDVDDDDPSSGTDDDDQTVIASFYPTEKMPNRWLVVGEPSAWQLLVIKRVTIDKTLTVKLEFTPRSRMRIVMRRERIQSFPPPIMIRRPILFGSSFRGFRRSFSTSPLVSNYLLSWGQHMEAIREVGRSHAASHAALIDKLNSRLATTNVEWKQDQKLISNLEREVADLKKENAKIQGNFTIRTALEIIADLYHNRLPNPMGRKGVQTVLDMIVNGHFDHQNSITYATAQNVALKSISPSVQPQKFIMNCRSIFMGLRWTQLYFKKRTLPGLKLLPFLVFCTSPQPPIST
ncbi:Sec63 Brl domain-containing protein [Lentinula edodes]|nr:Sec63 Brl domain-containing protein [Lentinula edodes]